MELVSTSWRKSSYSGSSSNNCVEVAVGKDVIMVRDTASRDGAVIKVDAAAWRRFIRSVR